MTKVFNSEKTDTYDQRQQKNSSMRRPFNQLWFNPFHGTFLDQSKNKENNFDENSKQYTFNFGKSSKGFAVKNSGIADSKNKNNRPKSGYIGHINFARSYFEPNQNEEDKVENLDIDEGNALEVSGLPARYEETEDQFGAQSVPLSQGMTKSDHSNQEYNDKTSKNYRSLLDHKISSKNSDRILIKHKPNRYIYNLKYDFDQTNFNKASKQIIDHASTVNMHK